MALLVIMLMVIEGCATHEKFVTKYNGWVGKDINLFIEKAGYPDRTFTLPNKNTVYVYERSRVYSVPGMPMMGWGYGYYGPSYGMFGYTSEIRSERCVLFIETNQKGKIVKWGSRGNRCISN